MRVAFVNSDISLGGGTTFLLNLGGELLRRGIPSKVFLLGADDSMREDFAKAGIPLWFRSGPAQTILEDIVLALYQGLREFSPTVLIVNIGDTCEIFRLTPPHVKRVAIAHTMEPYKTEVAAIYAEHCEGIVGVSRLTTEDMRSKLVCVKQPQLRTIELGFPFPDCAPNDAPPSAAIRLLYLGRLIDGAKRVRLFPGIYNQLVASGIPFLWTIAGDGPEQAYLESAMPSLGENQQVHFAGRVSYNQIPALLQQHDVILLTSDTESFSLSLHEAMAFGLIPVVSDIPGRVREVVTEEVGLRVPIDEPEKFAPAIEWLHAHREVWPCMKEAARKKISAEYSVSAMADRWMDFLNGLPSSGVEGPWVENPPMPAPLCFTNPYLSLAPARLVRRIAKRVRCLIRGLKKS